MDNSIHVPLNLPDVRVLSTHRTEQGQWLIRVESTLEGTQCRRCGREIHDLHRLWIRSCACLICRCSTCLS